MHCQAYLKRGPPAMYAQVTVALSFMCPGHPPTTPVAPVRRAECKGRKDTRKVLVTSLQYGTVQEQKPTNERNLGGAFLPGMNLSIYSDTTLHRTHRTIPAIWGSSERVEEGALTSENMGAGKKGVFL